jgi:hypothetical protein
MADQQPRRISPRWPRSEHRSTGKYHPPSRAPPVLMQRTTRHDSTAGDAAGKRGFVLFAPRRRVYRARKNDGAADGAATLARALARTDAIKEHPVEHTMTNPAANIEHTSPARTRRIANPAGRRFPRPRLERLWGPFEPGCLWSEYVPERPGADRRSRKKLSRTPYRRGSAVVYRRRAHWARLVRASRPQMEGRGHAQRDAYRWAVEERRRPSCAIERGGALGPA